MTMPTLKQKKQEIGMRIADAFCWNRELPGLVWELLLLQWCVVEDDKSG